jgi:hypothetical protein
VIAQRDAATVLETLSAAYPTHPMPPESVDLYLDALTTSPFDDFGALMAAVVHHVRTEDWHPTIHKLIEMYQAEARRRLADRQAAEADRIQRAGMLPGIAIDPGYAVEMLDVLRTAMAEVGTGGGLPDVAERLAAERGLRPPPSVETYACRECSDLGFIIEADHPFTVRPCMGCNSEAHQRWADGHMMPGHSCPDCRGRR